MHSIVVEREHPWARNIIQGSITLNCKAKRISLSEEDSNNSIVYKCSAKRYFEWRRFLQNASVLNRNTKRCCWGRTNAQTSNRIELSYKENILEWRRSLKNQSHWIAVKANILEWGTFFKNPFDGDEGAAVG